MRLASAAPAVEAARIATRSSQAFFISVIDRRQDRVAKEAHGRAAPVVVRRGDHHDQAFTGYHENQAAAIARRRTPDPFHPHSSGPPIPRECRQCTQRFASRGPTRSSRAQDDSSLAENDSSLAPVTAHGPTIRRGPRHSLPTLPIPRRSRGRGPAPRFASYFSSPSPWPVHRRLRMTRDGDRRLPPDRAHRSASRACHYRSVSFIALRYLATKQESLRRCTASADLE